MSPFTFALDLPPGIVSDDTTFGAEGRWADGNNVRFRLGRPEAVCASVFRQTLPAASATCRTIFTFQRSGSAMVAYGQSDNINSYVYVGAGTGVPSLRATLAGGTQFGWVFATWGDTLLFVRTATPGNPAAALSVYEQSGTGSATEITQAPNNITHMVATPERQLLALGCNEEASGTFNPRCIRGCDLEDHTDWTTSASNNAFEHTLDDPGAIVAATVIGAYVAVWTTTSLWIGQYIGDPAQTYRFDRVATNCGLMGAMAFTVVDQTAFWVGSDFRFRRWSPGGVPEIVPCPIFRDFEKNLGSASFYGGKVIVGANTRRQEVWIAYRDARDSSSNENSRYIAWHVQDGTWFRGDISVTAWDGSALAASAAGENLGAVLRANATQQILVHDVEGQGVAAGYIQSADQYLDQSQRRVMIRGFLPDFEEQVASVDLTLVVRARPMSSATTKGPYAITTATTKKNFRASGKIIAAKFSWPATSGTSGIRFGKPMFDVVPLGER